MSKLRGCLKWNNRFCIVLVAAAFLFGLFACDDYGSYLDLGGEEYITVQNVVGYANELVFREKRLPDISGSIEKDHGTAPYYPLGARWLLREISPDNTLTFPEATRVEWYVYTYVLFFLGCLALYGIVQELFHSHKLSIVMFFVYFLSPRFFAEGHYNNKDIIFLTFGLLVLFFSMRYIRSRRLVWGLLFAVAAAFMTNIKILGAWFFVMPGMMYLITGIKAKNLDLGGVLDGLKVILAYFLVYIAITPSIWIDGFHPIEYVQYCLTNASSFSRWSGQVLYAGRSIVISADSQIGSGVPADYLPLNILYTTPLILLAMCLVGHIRAVAAIIKREKNAPMYLMVLVLYLVPFVYALLNRNLVIYNGWRHFYFLYGGMLIFMAVGCRTILEFLKNRWLKLGLCGGIVVYLLCLVITGHPCQYSYVNILAERPAEKSWQLDYWNVGNALALDRLYTSEDRNRELELTVTGIEAVNNDLIYEDRWNNEIRYVNMMSGEQANYVICNTSYSNPPEAGYHLLLTIEAYGNCLFQIYETDGAGQ